MRLVHVSLQSIALSLLEVVAVSHAAAGIPIEPSSPTSEASPPDFVTTVTLYSLHPL